MSNPNLEFEKFLTEEANKHFKALPTASHDPSAQRLADAPDPKADLNLADNSLPTVGRHAVNDIDYTKFVDVVTPHKTSNPYDFDISNPPTSFDNLTDQHSLPSTIGFADSGRPALGSQPDPRDHGRTTLPFEDTYQDYLGGLREQLQSTTVLSHASQLPLEVGSSFYYFVKENHISTEGINSFSEIKDHADQAAALDVASIRNDFPILNEYVNGHKLVWFDNAATTQKPQVVIDRIAHFYQHENSNIHRAAHELAARSTDAYEGARTVVKQFLNAASTNEIIFTRGTTESINLVASSWGEQNLGTDDEIILSHLEHHANIVPWQLLSQRKGFKIRVIPVDDQGNLLVDEYTKLLTPRTKLVSFTHVSNALGTVTPVKQIIELAHQAGAKVLLDGAQSVSHIAVDLQYLDPDFFVFSGHKIFGPTGIGVLYGKEGLLNEMPPYQGGGNMIQDVSFEKTLFHAAPNRFEAGTGNIADAVGLGAALEYVQQIGLPAIYHYEHALLQYATKALEQVSGVTLIGTAREKTSVLSFTLKEVTNNDVGKALNDVGIAVRTGHHCAQPILRRLGYESSVRPSIAFYNTYQEIDLFIDTVEKLVWRTKRF